MIKSICKSYEGLLEYYTSIKLRKDLIQPVFYRIQDLQTATREMDIMHKDYFCIFELAYENIRIVESLELV